MFPGYAFRVVKQKQKQKWDIFAPEPHIPDSQSSPAHPIDTLKSERTAWKWVKERVDEGHYEVLHVGVGYKARNSSETPTDREYAQRFMREAMVKFLPSYGNTNLLHRLNPIFYP